MYTFQVDVDMSACFCSGDKCNAGSGCEMANCQAINTCNAVEEENYICQANGAAGLSAGVATIVLAIAAKLA
jgi:hypothetical protein